MLDPNDPMPVNRPALPAMSPADVARAQSVNPSQVPTGGPDLGYVGRALGTLQLGAALRGMLPAGGFMTGTPPVVEAAPVAHAAAALATAATKPVINPQTGGPEGYYKNPLTGNFTPNGVLPQEASDYQRPQASRFIPAALAPQAAQLMQASNPARAAQEAALNVAMSAAPRMTTADLIKTLQSIYAPSNTALNGWGMLQTGQ